jgi:glycosyltransferase involved in cell wall biosynthesis
MKIVFCANTSWYLYNFRRNLIAAVRRNEHSVFAASPRDAHVPKLTALGVRWYPLQMHQTSKNPVTEIRTLLRLANVIGQIQPDVMLTFTVKCNVYTGLLRKFFRFKHVANISGLGDSFTPRQPVSQWCSIQLYRKALRRAHRVFFQNEDDLAIFRQYRIVPESVCTRLPGSGVDLARFTPCYSDNAHRMETIFLMFGRILPAKGYEQFLEVARRLRKRFRKQADFWVLGIPDRSRKSSLRLFESILDEHARNTIRYIPPTDDVVSILRQVDVVVLPSEYNEGIPKCLLEALACGKPVITTNWRGCKETVEHGQNGFLIERGDIGALEKAIECCIGADRETLRKMGEASRRKAEREFDEHQVISTYLQAIRQITAGALTEPKA